MFASFDRRAVQGCAFAALAVLAASPALAAQSDDGALAGLAVGFLLLVAIGLAFYFLPTIIALVRAHEFRWVIFALNVAVGWTGLGWAAALVWSLWPSNKSLIEPFVGNPTGLSAVNSGDSLGAADYGRARGFHQARLASPQPLLTDDVLTQLERLARLLEAGAITSDEFAAHKAVILGRN